MNKGTTIAVIVAVFAVGMVFGGFSSIEGNTLGRATKDISGSAISKGISTPVVSITPDIAKPGNLMQGIVYPGSNGAIQGLKIYSLDDNGQLANLVDECVSCFCENDRVCYSNQNYNYVLPTLEPGFYAASVTDALTNEKIYAIFRVAQ